MTELPDQPDSCWPVDPGCLGVTWEDFPEDVQARAIALATSSLYRLTLGRVGGCPIQVRPCPRVELSAPPWLRSYPGPGWGPLLNSGVWVNCGCTSFTCNCLTGCEIQLPGYVGRVDEVKVGADIIPDTDYKIMDNEKIVYQGTADCPFPKTQDLSKPLGQDGTFSVTYLPAHPVDGSGAWAAGVLAVEFAKACTNVKCKLPSNVTQVTRQGVSMTLVSGAFPNGRTGIREVDVYLALWNPTGATVGVRVYSPDLPKAAYQS